ncbi:MAG: hypothetical protein ACE5JR_02340 [Gemmatimonadota bacterium]
MRAAAAALLLLLGGVQAGSAHAQEVSSDPRATAAPPFALGVPYPNPFRSTARIPFVLGDSAFASGGEVTVSMRIFSLLHQLVAIPTALDHPAGRGEPIDSLSYPRPGRYLALWDGRDRSGRRVASGPYFVQLLVNGESEVRKLLASR